MVAVLLVVEAAEAVLLLLLQQQQQQQQLLISLLSMISLYKLKRSSFRFLLKYRGYVLTLQIIPGVLSGRCL